MPDGTAAVSWTTDRITDAVVLLGTSPDSLTPYKSSVSGNAHIIVATGLKPGTTYYARLQSTDPDGNTKLWPAASSAPVSFVTSAAGVADHTAPSFRTGAAGSGVVVTDDGLGGVTLAAGASQGQFTSRVLDSAQMVTWDRLTYFADQPTGSKVQVSVRAGSTPNRTAHGPPGPRSARAAGSTRRPGTSNTRSTSSPARRELPSCAPSGSLTTVNCPPLSGEQ